jgi:hypothetical protein
MKLSSTKALSFLLKTFYTAYLADAAPHRVETAVIMVFLFF